MRNLVTNLVPEERQRLLTREYYLRFGVVIAFFATALVATAAALLLPSYVFLAANERAKEARLANIDATLSSADEAALSARLAALTSDASTLVALEDAPSSMDAINALLAISRPGISLTGMRYLPPQAGASGSLSVSGTAATRDALRNYQLALQGASFARKADLPVSAYAKDANIPFTIAITLAP